MRKILLFLLSYSISFGQINETLKELNVNEIQLNKPYQGSFKLNKLNQKTFSINNPLFNSVVYDLDNNGNVNFIRLFFNNKKIIKQAEEIINPILQDKFTSFKCRSQSYGNTCFFRNGLESGYVGYYQGSLFDVAWVQLHQDKLTITKNYDEFNKTTRYKVEGGYQSIDSHLGDTFEMYFVKIVSPLSSNVFMTVKKEGKDWRFIEKALFLTDNDDVTTIDARSSKDITDFGIQEVSVVPLPEELINKILKSKTVKLRLNGKMNDDFVFNEIQIEALRKVNDTK